MKRSLIVACSTLVTGLLLNSASHVAYAAGDLTKQEPVHITVELSNQAGEKKFSPSTLQFETGTLTVLNIHNKGEKSYYFGSNGLADSVYTRKVVVLGSASETPLAEIYGPVRRVEVYPGQTVQWWFVPIRTGNFNDLFSRQSEAEAGMKGTVKIN